MVDTAQRVAERLDATQELEVGPPALSSRPTGRALVLGGFVVGAALLALAYGVAGRWPDGRVHYLIFWAGMFAFLLPAAMRLWSPAVSVAERYALVVAVGLFTYGPKFLRNPDGPLFFDELGHWSRTERLLANGQVFARGELVRMTEFFPGLQGLSASIHAFTGLSTWHSAVLVIATLHVVALCGILVIGLRISGSYRIAGIAALVYALNPGFMFFNSQFAYQSLAIVLAIWSIAATLQGLHQRGTGRRVWMITAVTAAAGCTVTHHLSSAFLLTALIVVAIGTTLTMRGERGAVRSAWLVVVAVVAFDGFWTLVVASEVFVYLYQLSPLAVVGSRGRGGGGRSPFQESGLPLFEQLLAFAAPPVAAAMAFLGWRALRKWTPGAILAVTLSAAYIVSLPLILVNGGIEGAHRSWPFTYIGVAVLVAIGLTRFPRRLVAALAPRRWAVPAIVASIVVALTVGNLAGDVNNFYRFPGPWKSGTDTRNLTAELVGMTDWFVEHEGRNLGVIADLPTNAAFGSLGTARMAWREPLWDLYFYPEVENARLLRRLDDKGYRYIVVDRRMSEYVPRIGFYFTPDEPDAFVHTRPVDPSSLQKFDGEPWAEKIYASDNFSVYRVDFGVAADLVDQRQAG